MANYSDSAVAATGSKSTKAGAHRSQKAHGRSKGKKRGSKTSTGDVWERIRMGLRIPRPNPASSGFDPIKAPTGKNPSVSSTRMIKTPASIQAQQDDSNRLTTVIAPKKPLRGESQLPDKLRVRQALMPQQGSSIKLNKNPEERYTQLGRLKLGLKKSASNKRSSATGDSLFKSPSMQRIRTRLGLHPELFKQVEVAEKPSADDKMGGNAKSKGQQYAAVRNCADLNKQEIINLARQGILPEGYTQMAEQCRIKQNANYERVSRHIAGYSQRAGYLQQVSERARPYLYHIVDALSKYNLPLDLALLPIVESAYLPTALSNKDAAGIWQFIPGTGREYGLEQNGDYDARLEITASTHAAIRFLSGLNGHFKGDWLLALAAYNCGQGAVDAAISRNQAEGLDTDFWSLDLPAETQDYVPRLLALSAIFSNPDSYGLKLRPIKNEPYFIKVDIDRDADINQLVNKDLNTIAKLADFNTDEFGLLNSAYLKSTLSGSKPFTLLMPIRNANQLHQSLAFMAQSYQHERASPSPFFSIPLSSEPRWPTVQEPLLAINLDEGWQWPSVAKKLASPGIMATSTSTGGDTGRVKMTGEDYLAVHYIDKGESLKAVAEYHGISEAALREANRFKSRQSISLGQRLLIPLKQIAATSINRTSPSVLYKDMSWNFDPLRLRL